MEYQLVYLAKTITKCKAREWESKAAADECALLNVVTTSAALDLMSGAT